MLLAAVNIMLKINFRYSTVCLIVFFLLYGRDCSKPGAGLRKGNFKSACRTTVMENACHSIPSGNCLRKTSGASSPLSLSE